MGASWGGGPPRPIRDGGRPWTAGEVVGATIILAVTAALGVACWVGANRVGTHLRVLCDGGSTYACEASDGRQ